MAADLELLRRALPGARGDCPSKMPDAEIERLKAMVDAHGFVNCPTCLRSPAGMSTSATSELRSSAAPFRVFKLCTAG